VTAKRKKIASIPRTREEMATLYNSNGVPIMLEGEVSELVEAIQAECTHQWRHTDPDVERLARAGKRRQDVRRAIREVVSKEVYYWVEKFEADPGDAAEVLEGLVAELKSLARSKGRQG
jgi:hypothetical protein